MFKAISRINNFLKADHVKAAEMDYLNNCTSHSDLEYRMREVDRGLFKKTNNSLSSFY